jgi:8-oxo-dGTP pyrophosphatase MutT (NUDIX family)
MARRYDVDFGERRLTLADSQVIPDASSTVFPHANGAVAPIAFWTNRADHAWLSCADPSAAWKSLQRHTREVHAAGGLLTNEAGELLCIHRLGHWDLPKGKVEPGEDFPTAAAREVHEECGVPLPIVGRPFATTHHVYGPDDTLMKVTHWFRMRPSPGTMESRLQPQIEEGITEVRWASAEEVVQLEPLAFGNIARLMAAWRANP